MPTPLPESAHGEVPSASPDFRTELAARLAELVPEAVADGKLDVAKLRELLAEDVADDSERFGLFWPGKKRALRAAQAPTTATLKPDLANSKDWDTTQNVFIEGDNLEVLKILQRHYHNKVKLIYIDPPYNTGKDFVYPDNFTEGLDTYLAWTEQVNEEGAKISSNQETAGRFHSNWLNMMYPRLKLARNLLTDDGVIFISIDDNEQDNLKKLCNEVFGEGNFIGQITVVANPRGRDYGGIARMHDYTLAYRKSESFEMRLIPGDSSEFPFHDEISGFELRELRNRNIKFNKENRRNLYYPFYINAHNPDENGLFEIDVEPHAGWTELYPLESQGIDTVWRWGKPKSIENLNINIKAKPMKNGSYQIVEKYREAGMMARSVWWDKDTNTEKGTLLVKGMFQEKVFDYPKPIEMLVRFMQIGTGEDDLVLDFFAGSSSTAHATMQLNVEDGGNRRFIMVQLPEPTPEDSDARKAGFNTISEISRKRIALAGAKIKSDSGLMAQNLDVGFRAYKLVDTNFAKWHVTSEITPDALGQHLLDLRDSAADDASADDLLTELLLKLGHALTDTIATGTVADLAVRKVGDNRVLAYVDEHTKPTPEQLRALVDAEPDKLVVLEDAFHGDDELKTNLVQYAKTRNVELWTA